MNNKPIDVYHWTSFKNAQKILKTGLKKMSFVCKNSSFWEGDVCLKIVNMTDWDDNEEGDWQALTSEFIPPEKISIYIIKTNFKRSKMDYKITREELKRRQALPLRDKIDLSAERIESWYDRWNGKVHVTFSGGKDSTVLLHLVRSIFPEVPAMFADTGLEFPEVRNFVKDTPNVTMVRPRKNFRQVIEKYGYPVVSKDQSRCIHEYRRSHSEKLKDILINGNKWGMGKIAKKWLFLLDAPFLISHKCCNALKKYPAHKYENENDSKPFLGTMTEESFMRRETYLKYGCNGYNFARPTSAPLSFWTEEDIWNYIRQYNIPYSPIYNMGYTRTGCMFCMYGVHTEKTPNRFQKMQITHPKLWNYCINNLGEGKVLDYIKVPYKN